MSNPHQPNGPAKRTPEQQAGEEFGKIKRPQRGEGDFTGKADTPRGSEAEIRGEGGKR